MARATGVSQPHLHNILKGIRTLPPELADQLLTLAGLNLQSLMAGKHFEHGGFPDTPPAPVPHVNAAEVEIIAAKSDNPGSHYPAHQLGPDPSMEPRFRR